MNIENHAILSNQSIQLGLFVRLISKAGKEKEVIHFLKEALPLVQAENETLVWFALQLGDSIFGIFDAFNTESGRQSHLQGRVAQALFERAPDLFETPPIVELFNTLAFEIK